MITPTREKRDWTLLVFIIPVGIIFMLIAGQVAVRFVPEWSLNAGMQSNLDPGDLPDQQNAPVQPILPAILTPLGWFDTFLTPGASSGDEAFFPPFVIFEPSATPEVTLTSATQPSPTAPTATKPTVSASPPPATGTKPPNEDPPEPTSTSVVPTSATTVAPPIVPPTPTGTPSTPPAVAVRIDPPPTEIGINTPPDGVEANLPCRILGLPLGSYTVINLGGTPVKVSSTPDGNYDLIFYEWEPPSGSILLDHIIIGISNDNVNGSYYEVFNWGDNDPEDTNQNTNVETTKLDLNNPDPACTGANAPECDNREIPTSVLYPPPAGSSPHTGILIDVDNASGRPPAGTYQYIVIISPATGVFDPAQVDSIVVKEVPKAESMMAEESSETSSKVAEPPAEEPSEMQPEENVPSPPEDGASPAADGGSPADEEPAPPVDEAPAPPAEELPVSP